MPRARRHRVPSFGKLPLMALFPFLLKMTYFWRFLWCSLERRTLHIQPQNVNNAQTPNTHTALAFRSFFTVSRPSSLGFSPTCQSIFVFHTKILSPLLPFGSLSQLVCSRTPCFCFPKSEICHNSDISFFPIGYSITFRISRQPHNLVVSTEGRRAGRAQWQHLLPSGTQTQEQSLTDSLWAWDWGITFWIGFATQACIPDTHIHVRDTDIHLY